MTENLKTKIGAKPRRLEIKRLEGGEKLRLFAYDVYYQIELQVGKNRIQLLEDCRDYDAAEIERIYPQIRTAGEFYHFKEQLALKKVDGDSTSELDLDSDNY